MDNSDFFNDFDLGDGEYLNSYEDSAADLKFRAIKVDNFNQHDYFSSSSFPGASVMTMGTQFNKFVDVSPVKTNTFESGCPAQPRGMSNKNFIINNSDYASVVRSVSDFITTYNDNLDFSYSPMEHMWRGKFLYGSNCFEVEVNLYSNGPNGYVCAVRNCKCDCACCGTFNAFFNDLKSKLGTEPAKGPARKAFVIPPMCPLMCPPVSPEEFLSGIQPVFCMAKGCWESRIQAAKMLCDVSRKCSTYLSLPAFRGEAVRALEGFVADECEEVRQYAFMAIAAFVEVPAYHELFLCSRILSALFLLIENPADPSVSYETAQVRRQAAAALAHLSRSNAYAVRAGLHQQQCDVVHWMARVGSLQDARTRAAALEIKACLEQVTENMPMSTSDEFPLQSSSIGEEGAFAELVR